MGKPLMGLPLMEKKKYHSLQRTMAIYFLLVLFASCLLGVEFIMDTSRMELKQQIMDNFQRFGGNAGSADYIFHPVDVIRNKAIIMVLMTLSVMVIVFTMFMHNITEPLQYMINISRKISCGDLNQTISIKRNNELAELGGVINELTSNLQELLLLSKEVCGSGDRLIKGVSRLSGQEWPKEDVLAEIEHERNSLGKKIEVMGKIMGQCRLFGIGEGTGEQ
jgi:methyl-accepting chemotaxis protein